MTRGIDGEVHAGPNAVLALGRWRGIGAIGGLAFSLMVIVTFTLPAILDEVDAPSTEEFMQQDVAEDILPMRGISIGD